MGNVAGGDIALGNGERCQQETTQNQMLRKGEIATRDIVE